MTEHIRSKLAIYGGTPVRDSKIYYGKQWIDENDISAVADALRGDLITGGPKVAEFEKRLADYVGSEYAVAVSSGTAALHCACMAAGITEKDEVIVSAMTFMPSANCVLYCGGRPVFADIDPETFNISAESIESVITPATKAVIAVDFAGQSVDHVKIREICDRYGLIFIEDAAHAIGTEYQGKRIGSLADLTCFSFHPVKTITGGEGGAVTTDNEAFHQKLLTLREHGMVRNPAYMEQVPEGPWCYEQQMLGYNYRLSAVQCALLSSQMNRIDFFVERRKEIARRYWDAFSDIPEITMQRNLEESDTCWHIFVIKLNLMRLCCTRREFFDAMDAENIHCNVQYLPVYLHPYYRNLGYREGLCPETEKLYREIITIPLYPRMTDRDVCDVICGIKKVVDAYRK